MNLNRRDAVKLLLASGIAPALPNFAWSNRSHSTFTLENGLRTHLLANSSKYISAALTLQSREIMDPGGLAHILEHTSFCGAAGPYAAKEIRERHKAFIQESNASTEEGLIQWHATFLPKYLPEVLNLLAITSLDQRFDVETVARESRVVLQELYLDKHGHHKSRAEKDFTCALFGKSHPYARDWLETEILKAKTPPKKLAAELREHAVKLRLPANMDLFLVGGFEEEAVKQTIKKQFGQYPFAQGPYLQFPHVGMTRSHHALTGPSQEFKRPVSEIKFAWNTGVCINDQDAGLLLALSRYMDDIVFAELREKHGDTYSPETSYEPNRCSGVFVVELQSTKEPSQVERRLFEAVETIKQAVNREGLQRLKERMELKQIKSAADNEALLECLVERVVEGKSVYDLDFERITAEDIKAAAKKHLPSYRGGYVRLTLLGR